MHPSAFIHANKEVESDIFRVQRYLWRYWSNLISFFLKGPILSKHTQIHRQTIQIEKTTYIIRKPWILKTEKLILVITIWLSWNIENAKSKTANHRLSHKIQGINIFLKHVRGTKRSLAYRLAMTWGQPRPNNFGIFFKNPEFWSHRAKIPVIKNYTPGCERKN